MSVYKELEYERKTTLLTNTVTTLSYLINLFPLLINTLAFYESKSWGTIGALLFNL